MTRTSQACFQSSIEMRSEPDSTESGTCRWLAVPLRKKCGTSGWISHPNHFLVWEDLFPPLAGTNLYLLYRKYQRWVVINFFFFHNRLFWFLTSFHSRTKIVLTFFEKTFIPCLVLYFYFSWCSTGSFTIDSKD